MQKYAKRICIEYVYSAQSEIRTRTTRSGQGILSPSRLPFRHKGN